MTARDLSADERPKVGGEVAPESWWPEHIKAAWGNQCSECGLWNGWHYEDCSQSNNDRYTALRVSTDTSHETKGK